jgi:hypothetical protein
VATGTQSGIDCDWSAMVGNGSKRAQMEQAPAATMIIRRTAIAKIAADCRG